jgi:hypothetical protein
MKHAIKALRDAQQRAGSATPEERKELSRAISILRAIGAKRLPEPFVATQLGAVDFGSFAEYRLFWDYETERSADWQEMPLRLSPGDIVITCREQFAESEKRRTTKKPNQSAQTRSLTRPV